MVFPSVQFAIFFPVVLVLSWALMRRPKAWRPFIIVASYGFYAAANPRFCVLLAAVTLGNQGASLLIHRSTGERRRRAIMWTAVVGNLCVLGAFKYYGFFAQGFADLFHDVGLGAPVPLLTIALPVGVSFFTFQAISYTVDVWRRTIEPTSTVDLAIYLSFFPHLVAGPIVRAREFLPQLATPRDPKNVRLGAGIALICVGLVKKVVLADYLARTVVDPVFGAPLAYHAPDVLLASYGYTAQIYCDFSGYTDIAIGLALLMGFVFPQNFDRPYRATSFREFWRRWHMTLSRFLRDFLYIPLGGNRGGRWFTMRNLFITMLLGGLWHGAAWTFVLWGALHGAYLAVERLLDGRLRVPAVVRWLVVFHGVVLGWILFRSQTLGGVGDVLGQLGSWGSPTLLSTGVVVAILVVIGGQLLPTAWPDRLRLRFEALPAPALGLALAAVILVAAATVPSQGVPPFIYFRF